MSLTHGFVPTMGSLHEGHLSLVKKAKAQCDRVSVSIFVNPTQFGPTEDYAKYPRTLERDMALLDALGVDTIYSPKIEDIYPQGTAHLPILSVPPLAKTLCGQSRPQFFQGVLQVLSRLFDLVQPDMVFMGEKDYQQFKVVSHFAKVAYPHIKIVGCPVIRESDGLAMSSRNQYLSQEARNIAPRLYRGLLKIKEAVRDGVKDVAELIAVAAPFYADFKLDYLEILDEETFEGQSKISDKSRVFVAAFLENTRLIDNVCLVDF